MNQIISSKDHFRDLRKIEKYQQVSGLNPTEDREVIYIEDKGKKSFSEVFKNLVRHINPPLMTGGGALIDGCVLILSSGRRFQAISYRGDLDGWRKQVTQGAAASNIIIGHLKDNELILTDGSSHSLSECAVEFY